MRKLINNIISVVYSGIRFILLKLFRFKQFRFHLIERFSPNVVFELNRGGKATLGSKVRVHSGSKIKIRGNGQLTIEDGVKINYYCIIVCRHKISIGKGTEFGPSVYLYDHDHDYQMGLKNNEFRVGSITIGENCWIGANTVILRGTSIGNNCVIGAGSIVKGDIPDNTILVQKRTDSIRSILEEE